MIKKEQIHIRDPFVVYESGTYYLYGTRAENFGCYTNGFDVYVSKDLVNWDGPTECFCSDAHGLNRRVNWAPEVHKYKGKYYMLATFTQENGLRGTYALCSDNLLGPFVPHSNGPLTPSEWECLDGTLYVDETNTPYLVFCREHTKILDGTVCYVQLSEDLRSPKGEVTTLFAASSCAWVSPINKDHYVTDGPFLFRSKQGTLLMIWSSFVQGQYAELLVRFKDGRLDGEMEHLQPILDTDGGHGMIFSNDTTTYFVCHSPNQKGLERPSFRLLEDRGESVSVSDPIFLPDNDE